VSLPACKLSRSMLSHIVIMCSIPGMKAHAASTPGRLPSIHKRLYRQNLFPAIGVNELGQTPSRQAQLVWPSGDFKHGSVMTLDIARRHLPGPQIARLRRRSGSCRRKPQAGEDARVLRSSEWDTLLRAAAQSIRSTIATRPESALRRERGRELKQMRAISNQEKPR
jgi:hypothetical protein